MTSIKERLRKKVYVNEVYKKLHTPVVRDMIAKQMYEDAIEKRLMTEKQDFIYDGVELPIPAIIVEFIFQILSKHPNIENIQINTKEKMIHAEIEREHSIVPWKE